MLYKTFRGANNTGKGEQQIPPLKSPNDPQLNTQWLSISTPTCLITCCYPQNYHIFTVIPKIVQYSLSTTGALFTMWCSLYWLSLIAIINQLSYNSMFTTIIGCFGPKQGLTECVEARDFFFRKKSINDYRSGRHQRLVNIKWNRHPTSKRPVPKCQSWSQFLW